MRRLGRRGEHRWTLGNDPRINDSIVSAWRMDEDGGSAFDFVSGLHIPETSGAPINQTAGPSANVPFGRAFNGTNECMILDSDHKSFLKWASTSWSVTFWFRVNSEPGGYDPYLISAWRWENNNRSWHAYWERSDNRLNFVRSTNGLDATNIYANSGSSGVMSLSTWYLGYFGVVYGVEIQCAYNAAAGAVTTATAALLDGNSRMAIGSNPNTSPGDFANCAIAQVVWYNRCLIQDERSYVYNGGLGQPLIQRYYRMPRGMAA